MPRSFVQLATPPVENVTISMPGAKPNRAGLQEQRRHGFECGRGDNRTAQHQPAPGRVGRIRIADNRHPSLRGRRQFRCDRTIRTYSRPIHSNIDCSVESHDPVAHVPIQGSRFRAGQGRDMIRRNSSVYSARVPRIKSDGAALLPKGIPPIPAQVGAWKTQASSTVAARFQLPFTPPR